MKTNDIHVCAFPKSGVTYFGFLLVAARLRHNQIALVPTMYNIDFLLIDIHKMSNSAPASIWRDGIGDLFKSHDPYFGVPNVVYLLRNPLDTLRSYYHFRTQLGVQSSARDFLTGPEGIAAWVNHVKSWLIDNRNASQSLFVTEYEELQSNPREELRALGRQLGLEFSDNTLDFALRAAGLDSMRALEASFVARNPVNAQFQLEFVRKSDRRTVDAITPDLVTLINTQATPVYELAKSRLADARSRGAA
jgi:hypothetical protein